MPGHTATMRLCNALDFNCIPAFFRNMDAINWLVTRESPAPGEVVNVHGVVRPVLAKGTILMRFLPHYHIHAFAVNIIETPDTYGILDWQRVYDSRLPSGVYPRYTAVPPTLHMEGTRVPLRVDEDDNVFVEVGLISPTSGPPTLWTFGANSPIPFGPRYEHQDCANDVGFLLNTRHASKPPGYPETAHYIPTDFLPWLYDTATHPDGSVVGAMSLSIGNSSTRFEVPVILKQELIFQLDLHSLLHYAVNISTHQPDVRIELLGQQENMRLRVGTFITPIEKNRAGLPYIRVTIHVPKQYPPPPLRLDTGPHRVTPTRVLFNFQDTTDVAILPVHFQEFLFEPQPPPRYQVPHLGHPIAKRGLIRFKLPSVSFVTEMPCILLSCGWTRWVLPQRRFLNTPLPDGTLPVIERADFQSVLRLQDGDEIKRIKLHDPFPSVWVNMLRPPATA